MNFALRVEAFFQCDATDMQRARLQSITLSSTSESDSAIGCCDSR
jgi:hypothetical protein